MNLTLFILVTTEENRSIKKTLNSLEDIDHEYIIVGSIDKINNSERKTDWYLVLYDNEFLSLDLSSALKSILTMNVPFDALIFLEKYNGKFYQSPRLFKNHVKLRENSLLPENCSTKMERILDGWIYKHGN